MRANAGTFAGLLVVVLGLGGCSDGDDDIPARPQIMPHINPVNACEQWLGDGVMPPQQWRFDLLLFNFGRERLEISGFEVRHDRRCGFAAPGGGVRLYDNDSGDAFAATARLNDAAIMRIEYVPPGEGEDEIAIIVRSNAENFPELPIYVCAAGTSGNRPNCRIRVDPACTSSGSACESDLDCPAQETCNRETFDDPAGTCQCRPCGVPPDESWPDCEQD